MWGWLKAIGGFLTGGSKTAEKVVEMADDAVFTKQEAATQDSSDTTSARADQGVSHNTWLDVIVDGWSRLVRPGFATWAFGELVGWWNVKTGEISADKFQLIIIIVTFYFGARVLLKDLPSIVKAFRSIK